MKIQIGIFNVLIKVTLVLSILFLDTKKLAVKL